MAESMDHPLKKPKWKCYYYQDCWVTVFEGIGKIIKGKMSKECMIDRNKELNNTTLGAYVSATWISAFHMVERYIKSLYSQKNHH